MMNRKNTAGAPNSRAANQELTQETDGVPVAAEQLAQEGRMFTVARTATVEPLKLTKAGHAELASGLAIELRDAMEGIARFRGFTNLADAKGSTLFVGEYKSKLDVLATYESEAERADG